MSSELLDPFISQFNGSRIEDLGPVDKCLFPSIALEIRSMKLAKKKC
jgi:hypothetical protein